MPTLRRLAAPALVAALVLAGCGGDGDDDDRGDEAPTTEEQADAATTADDGSTTTAPGDEDGGTTDTDEAPDDTPPDTAGQGQEGTGAPDEEATDVSWGLDATEYRGQDGRRIAFLCPPDGEIGSVWGTGTYTDDSSVCSAAVHAGLINTVEGGRVVIEIAPGEDAYEGTEAKGVSSRDYGSWSGSFTFPVG